MTSLLKRAEAIIKKFKIDVDSVFEMCNIYSQFSSTPTPVISGTVVKYHAEDYDTIRIQILLNSGWNKCYTYRSKADMVHIIRDMEHNSFKQREIGAILNISQAQVSSLSRRKGVSRKDGEYDEST